VFVYQVLGYRPELEMEVAELGHVADVESRALAYERI
jgi:hypothetical protein